MMYLGDKAVGLPYLLPYLGNKALIETGEYTPEEDINVPKVRITHNLGVIPDFCIYFSDAFESTASDERVYCANGYFSKIGLQSAQTDNTKGFGYYVRANKGSTSAVMNSWQDVMTNFFTNYDFTFPRYNSGEYLKSGITYHWVIGKFIDKGGDT